MATQAEIDDARRRWDGLKADLAAAQAQVRELDTAATAAYDEWIRLSTPPAISLAQAQEQQAIVAYREAKWRVRTLVNGSPAHFEATLQVESLEKAFRTRGVTEEQIAAFVE